MMNYVKPLIEKYKDAIPYLICGVLTTLVNIVSFWICAHLLDIPTMVSTIIAWILAVLFAYVTNRTWVFHSKANTKAEIIREMTTFITCRLFTGFLDWFSMFLFVEIMHFNDLIIKIVIDIFVCIFNYLASKLFIFRK